MEGKQNKIFEGNQNINFGRKPKTLEGNQKFRKENKIKFWKETKKIGIEILTSLGHRNRPILHFSL